MTEQVSLKLYDVYFIATSNLAAPSIIATSAKKAKEIVADKQGISLLYLKAKLISERV